MTAPLNSLQERAITEAVRSIYFYRPDAGQDDKGESLPYKYRDILKAVQAKPFTKDGGRYWEQDDGNYLSAWIDQIDEISHVRFSVIRRNALPQSELAGKLEDLLLGEEQGLCETSHLCFFPSGIIGVEFNFWGPRPQRLTRYLTRIVDAPTAVMEGLIRNDIAERLVKKKALRRMTLRVRASAISQIEQADESLGAALNATARAGASQCVGVILEPEPYGRANLREGLLDATRLILGLPGLRTEFREFQVRAVDEDSSQVEDINLLEDKLIKKKSILRQSRRSRVLDRSSAYAEIESAYTELRQDLLSAASVNLSAD